MKSEEVWKPIEGFPHSVSNLGRVRLDRGVRKTKIKDKEKYNLKNTEEGTFTIISRNQLLSRYFPWEWIKELEEGEEVKPIPHPTGYFITNRGRVWSSHYHRFLIPQRVKDSYYHKVCIGGRKRYYHPEIHTLVGRNFLPEWREGLLILHKEEKLSYPEIHYVENLWVGTHLDNMRDMAKKGRCRNAFS